MSDPNSMGHPDTYLGNFWVDTCFSCYDNGGVHINSNVQNYWYYLLSEGGSGTNDNGDSYNVNSIGLNSASLIAYRTLSVYLTPSSNFQDARNYSIQSAIDLFGVYSNEHAAVEDAWYAVGIGEQYNGDVYVPDDNFENYLEANGMGDGIYGNDSVLTANVVNVLLLNVSSLNITDLTGIEAFTSLENLDCSMNNLTSLNINNNTALVILDCSDNQLNTLSIAYNTGILNLNCQNNQFTTLYLKNNNNTNLSNANFNCTANNSLYCIDVDDAIWSTANWTNIDAQHYFDNNCSGGYGCTDPMACNYDASNIYDDGSCILPDGCTDTTATNYDPLALCDDGGCCYDNLTSVVINTASWGYEMSWDITDSTGVVLLSGGPGYADYTDSVDVQSLCMNIGCYTMNMYDSYGDGWNGGSFAIYNFNGTLVDRSGPPPLT